MPRKNKKNPRSKEQRPTMHPETRRGVVVIFFFTCAAILLLALLNLGGTVGVSIADTLRSFFGNTSLIIPLAFAVLGAIFLLPTQHGFRGVSLAGIVIFFLASTTLLATFRAFIPETHLVGGVLGDTLAAPLMTGFGRWGTFIIAIALVLVSILLIGNTSLEALGKRGKLIGSLLLWIFKRRTASEGNGSGPRVLVGGEPVKLTEVQGGNKEPSFVLKDLPWKKKGEILRSAQNDNENARTDTKEIVSEFSEGLKTKKKRRIDIPLDLLATRGQKPSAGDIKHTMEVIEKTLANFGIPVEMGDVSVGPTVTQYTLKPQEGIKLTKITALQNDLALALAAHPIRMEAPIPGKSLVGIEVPNQSVAIVGLREIIETPPFRERADNLYLALGKDVAGHPWFADLPRMPHMLVAGATGSGKTVCLNTMIVSLLFQNNPDDLKLILIDPKRVELPVYNGIPHLLVPTITDVQKTINALRWTVGEMERRFKTLEEFGARDIQSYNTKAPEKMPAIVVVIDELADLMAAAANEVESSIIRIAQMARAVGIHLIVATQRPSVDVITGLIKANIPARIAFAVASQTDSRTILDTSGAEKLLGRGDMLFTSPEISKPRRIQGAFVSDEEIKRVVNYVKDEYDAPDYDHTIIAKQQGNGKIVMDGDGGGDDDPLIPEAKEVIVSADKASASLLQRRLKVGYARAARLLDLLEAQGFIGPGDGAKPREVLGGHAMSGTPSGAPDDDVGDENGVPPWE